jgi:hypothetical protein
MGLFDALAAQTPEGEALRAGLLGMGTGLLSGSVGYGGAFAPALAQGFAGFAAGRQNALTAQQEAQQRALQQQMMTLRQNELQRQISQQQQAEQWFQPGATSEALSDRIHQALNSPNPEIRQWGFKMLDVQNAGRQGMSGLVPTDQGYAYRDPQGNMVIAKGPDGRPLMPVSLLSQDPTRQGEIAMSRAYGQQTGKSQAEREDQAPAELETIAQMRTTINQVKNHPGFSSAVGWQGMFPTLPGTKERGFVTALDQLKGQTFLQAYQRLKGGGQITEIEGKKAEAAIARLDRAQSEEDFKAALADLESVLDAAEQRIRSQAGGAARQAVTGGQAPQGAQGSQPAKGDYSNLWGG